MPGWPADDGAGPRVVALCGLGGAGKTSVAVEYAHRHLAEVGVAWQFPAEDPAVLAAEFARAGRPAGRAGGGRMPRDPVASVHAVLAACRGRVAAGVRQRAGPGVGGSAFVPPAGPGRVLITSQSQHWPPGQAVEVPVLDTGGGGGFPGEPDR